MSELLLATLGLSLLGFLMNAQQYLEHVHLFFSSVKADGVVGAGVRSAAEP